MTWVIHLDDRPVWNPPSRPTVDDFRQVFPDVPVLPDTTNRIHVRLLWDKMLTLFFLCLWGVTVLAAILSLLEQSPHCGLTQCIVRALVVTFGIAAALCLLLWMFVGGWGAPFPLAFACGGFASGLWFGAKKWASQRST